MKNNNIRRLSFSAIICALSLVLIYLCRFSPFPAPYDFLKYDPADIVLLLGCLTVGSFYGMMSVLVVCMLHWLLLDFQGGVYGFIMHLIATGSLVLVFSVVYKYVKISGEKIRLLAALIIGSLVAVGLMLVANLIVTPLFMGVPVSAVKGILWTVILPFNLLKLCGNALITLLLYSFYRKNVPMI